MQLSYPNLKQAILVTYWSVLTNFDYPQLGQEVNQYHYKFLVLQEHFLSLSLCDLREDFSYGRLREQLP